MSDQSVFSATDPLATPTPEPVLQAQPNAYEDLLKSIKNDQGLPKYATLEDALKALQHSQAYIPEVKSQLTRQEQEIARLQAELEQRQSIEEVVSRLAKPNQPEPVVNQPRGSGLDESAVNQLVLNALSQQAAQVVSSQNQAQVEAALNAKYGDKAQEVVKQRASELGLTPQALGELSSKSPQAVLALFNTQGASAPKPTTSSVNIPSSFNQGQPTLERPTKSLLTGASMKDQAAFMAKVREEVYRENGIT